MYTKPAVSEPPCFSCGKPAEVHYAWPWGEQGYACNGCVPQLRSTAARLSREVAIVSLFAPTPAAPAPSDRDELFRVTQEVELRDKQIAELEQLLRRREEQIDTLSAQVRELQGGAAHA